MVVVSENDLGVQTGQIVGGEGFDGGVGADRHKHGSDNFTMRGSEFARAAEPWQFGSDGELKHLAILYIDRRFQSMVY